MRSLSLLCLIASTLIVGCAPPKPSPIEGAWKLQHATWVHRDSLVGEYPGMWVGGGMKMWTRDHFAFVGRYKSDTTNFDSFGGGMYKLDGDRYEEIIQYHIATGMVGDTVKMLLEIKADTLTQTWPVGTNGQIDRKNFNEEKYVRLE